MGFDVSKADLIALVEPPAGFSASKASVLAWLEPNDVRFSKVEVLAWLDSTGGGTGRRRQIINS